MMESIWSTVEADAWARSFTYEEYLDYKAKVNPIPAPNPFTIVSTKL